MSLIQKWIITISVFMFSFGVVIGSGAMILEAMKGRYKLPVDSYGQISQIYRYDTWTSRFIDVSSSFVLPEGIKDLK